MPKYMMIIIVIVLIIILGAFYFFTSKKSHDSTVESATQTGYQVNTENQTNPQKTMTKTNTTNQSQDEQPNNSIDQVTGNNTVITVTFSELMENPEKYNGKVIRTTGCSAAGYERRLLFESEASKLSQGTSIWIATQNIQETNKKYDKPNSQLGYIADAVVEGVFEYDPAINYGHVGFAHAQIR